MADAREDAPRDEAENETENEAENEAAVEAALKTFEETGGEEAIEALIGALPDEYDGIETAHPRWPHVVHPLTNAAAFFYRETERNDTEHLDLTSPRPRPTSET